MRSIQSSIWTMLVLLVWFVCPGCFSRVAHSHSEHSQDYDADHVQHFYVLASEVKSQRSYLGFFQNVNISEQRASCVNFEVFPS